MATVRDKSRDNSILDVGISRGQGTSSHSYAITPSNTVDLSPRPRELYVGTGGTVALETMSGDTVSFNVPDGGTITQICRKVLSTGTSATGIVAIV